MPGVHHGYAKHAPWICQMYAMDTPKVWHGYAKGTPWIHQRNAEVRHRYAKGMPWYAMDMPKVHQWPYHGYAIGICQRFPNPEIVREKSEN